MARVEVDSGNLKASIPGGSVVKNLPAKAGDSGDANSIPELEAPMGLQSVRSQRVGHD